VLDQSGGGESRGQKVSLRLWRGWKLRQRVERRDHGGRRGVSRMLLFFDEWGSRRREGEPNILLLDSAPPSPLFHLPLLSMNQRFGSQNQSASRSRTKRKKRERRTLFEGQRQRPSREGGLKKDLQCVFRGGGRREESKRDVTIPLSIPLLKRPSKRKGPRGWHRR